VVAFRARVQTSLYSAPMLRIKCLVYHKPLASPLPPSHTSSPHNHTCDTIWTGRKWNWRIRILLIQYTYCLALIDSSPRNLFRISYLTSIVETGLCVSLCYDRIRRKSCTVGAKSLESAKSLERSAKKALNSTKKALYLDFQFFSVKYSHFSILFSKKKLKNFFLKSDY
jgi:hypothetical protein